MKNDLAIMFQNDMYACSVKYREKTRRTPVRYHQMIQRLGGVGAARDLALAPGFQTGLEKAAEHDCIDLTSEYLIVYGDNGNYQTLFSDDVVAAARKKLQALYQYRDALKGSKNASR